MLEHQDHRGVWPYKIYESRRFAAGEWVIWNVRKGFRARTKIFQRCISVNDRKQTWESADSPPCNCRYFWFFILKMTWLKTSFFNVFYMFHFWKAFRVRVSFCTAWANSIWKTWFFVRAKWSFSLNTPRKKFGNACWSKKSNAQTA